MQKTKKCVYCDMDLKPHTMICKLCGRPQKLVVQVKDAATGEILKTEKFPMS